MMPYTDIIFKYLLAAGTSCSDIDELIRPHYKLFELLQKLQVISVKHGIRGPLEFDENSESFGGISKAESSYVKFMESR